MLKFFKLDAGLVTIEWVGVAAVLVLAAIAITSVTVQSGAHAGEHVASGLQSVDAPGPTIGVMGDGIAGPVN